MKLATMFGLIAAAAIGGGPVFAAGPTTLCPAANFVCGLSASQTKPLDDPSNPGQPSAIIGYLSFNNNAVPTVVVLQNKDGTLKPLATVSGTCTGGTNGSPGTLDFTANSGPKLAFVTFGNGTDLRFISSDPGTGISPVLGSCRQK